MDLTPLAKLGDWILIALLQSSDHRAEENEVARRLLETEFEPTDEDTEEDPDRPGWPHWQSRIYGAQRCLVAAQWLRVDRQWWTLTRAGEAAAQVAAARVWSHADEPVTKLPDERRQVRPSVMAAPLLNPDELAQLGFPTDEAVPLPVLVELNVLYSGGVDEAFWELDRMCKTFTPAPVLQRLGEDFVHLRLSMERLRALVEADAETPEDDKRAIYRIWPDFPVQPLIDASSRTIKADAARRSFRALGEGVVWAVIDSGIEQSHPHFHDHETLTDPSVFDLHRDFNMSLEPDITTRDDALTDQRGHGTHVAGIIAGEVPAKLDEDHVQVLRDQYADAERAQPGDVTGRRYNRELLAGMAPQTRLVSLKALPPEEDSDMGRVIAALQYIRRVNASSDRLMRIHGVNISVGYEFDPQWFACGQSPLCKEVDRLVRTGVVVVVAAGNTGYGRISVQQEACESAVASSRC